MKENNRPVSIMEYYLKLTIALYVALTIDFAFIGIITYYALKGQFLDKYIYTLAAVFFISQVLIIYMFSVGLEATNTSLVMTILSLLAVGFATMFVFQNLNLKRIFGGPDQTAFYTLVALSCIIVLAVLYGYGKDFIMAYRNERRPSWFGFFMNLLFFIPCALYDLAEYLTEEYTNTSTPIVFLLILEIILLSLYFYGSKIPWTSHKTLLSATPLFLRHKVVLSGNQPMLVSNLACPNGEKASPSIQKDYAFSMWIYINDYTSNNDGLKATQRPPQQIFCYGDEKRGKPLIEYQNRHILVSFSNASSTEKSAQKITMQKWNHVVVNYKYNEADVFVNGVLVHSRSLVNEMPVYDVSDLVSVGDEKGIDGAIVNIYYSNKSLNRGEITYEYNMGPSLE